MNGTTRDLHDWLFRIFPANEAAEMYLDHLREECAEYDSSKYIARLEQELSDALSATKENHD